MNKEDLKRAVADALKDNQGDAMTSYRQAVQKLRELAAAVQEFFPPGAVEVAVEAGHRVNLGQQYNFVVRADKVKLRDVLFRAYVPPDGYPVTLDLFDEEHPECADVDALEKEIIRFFSHRDVKARLLQVRDLAA